MAEFILEIGTEEIPARMLKKAADDLRDALEVFFKENQLATANLESSAAPRQLVVTSSAVATQQADRREWVYGPPVRIAFDSAGKATKALEGFLRKNPGIQPEHLVQVDQPKGKVVAAELAIAGRATRDLLGEAIPGMLDKLHFAKNMRWGSCPTRFVRPIRNLVAMLDGNVIPFEFGGMATTNTSFGHRVFGKSGFAITSIAQFHSEKAKNNILCQHDERKSKIVAQIQSHLATVGGHLVEDSQLLNEVADLVEIPHVVFGSFDPKFLQIPREVLVTSIREHQKSFCVENGQGNLLPHFLSVASVPHDSKGLVQKGNEWVLNARLWDAKFFWEADLKKDFPLLREKLKDLMFIQQVGSYFQKSERLRQLVSWMTSTLGWDASEGAFAERAATFAKADLVSDLVFEFPELQGIAGGLLLKAKGEPSQVWKAVYDHYLPQTMDGELPESDSGALVALADKLDTLVGCFAAGLIPTGSKDPYALRRAAQGIVQILVDKGFALPLDQLLNQTIALFAGDLEVPKDLHATLVAFFQDRQRYFLKLRGFDHELINGVLATDPQRVDQILLRANAVSKQQVLPHFRDLALNLKRISNILQDEKDRLPPFSEALLREPLEHELWKQYQEQKPLIDAAVASRDYNLAMELMARLADPIYAYFDTDGVFINTDETPVRLNRKSMLNHVRETLGLVADISCLAPKG